MSKRWQPLHDVPITDIGQAICFVLPALVVYAIFFIYPFLSSIYLSMTDWDGMNPMNLHRAWRITGNCWATR